MSHNWLDTQDFEALTESKKTGRGKTGTISLVLITAESQL